MRLLKCGVMLSMLVGAAVLSLWPVTVGAQKGLRPLPPLLRSVSDEAGVLSGDERRRLAQALKETRVRTGVRIIMTIAETTQPEAIEEYGERLARRWNERGLDFDRAILIVIAVRDREVQVMPGRALAAVDRELDRRGMLADLAPLFRQGRYFEALMALNASLAELIRMHGPSTKPARERAHGLGGARDGWAHNENGRPKAPVKTGAQLAGLRRKESSPRRISCCRLI